MTQNKEWKPFVEQLDLLKKRGLQVDNESAALNYLDRIGYYRLSGYWYSFRELEIIQGATGQLTASRKNQFIENSHFEDAVKLYVFDKKLRMLAVDALERIELAVRVDIAHLLGEYDTHAHENPALFHGHFARQRIRNGRDEGKTQHDLWLERHSQVLQRARREPFVAHYNNKYGRLPIWVAIEVWDFGLMSKLFAGMKPADQMSIANKYGAANGRAFSGWLRSFNFIRNVSAHHSRLWNINILERAALLQEDSYWQQLNNARPFYYYCLMQKLMKVICPNSSWGQRFADLMSEFPAVSCGSVSLRDFDLLEDWQEWELWP
ncbi:Abi family protein [Haliea sp. AH-315-K21]|uniref:Abortive phage resistance protein n=1 Tax=SAR86 cluster bacterium TaxID=2030880 RepID=A0A2A5CHM8_9GAMM|nr:Abi family protein [Haliea sp. AH-315-K21]MBN4075648.1 Abi family protein [Gammaproteobacteria bacterium AH-315-E17]PCJ42886.1 MAG: abortive phage resistance protein [SAR86 cluster bacterium]